MNNSNNINIENNDRLDTIGITFKDSQAQIEGITSNKLELNEQETNPSKLKKEKDKINIPKLELAHINTQKIDFCQFTDDKTNASSILPPSSLGDKAIEISAIQIDKNDLSLHMDARNLRPKLQYLPIDENAGMTKCEICWRNFMIACSLICCAASSSMFIYGLAMHLSK